MAHRSLNEKLHDQGPYSPFLFASDPGFEEVGPPIRIGNRPTNQSVLTYETPGQLADDLVKEQSSLDVGEAQ